MALVFNASAIEQQICVHGSWFTFKPKAQKIMNEDKAFHLTTTCGYLGFVGLPDAFEDPDYQKSEEGKAALKAAEETGVRNRIQYLEGLKQNELISLQRDLDRNNFKYDARIEMSDGMMKNLEELASYKSKKQDEAAKKLDKVKELEKLLEE